MVNVIKLLDKREGKKYPVKYGMTSLGRQDSNDVVYRPRGFATLHSSVMGFGKVYDREESVPRGTFVSREHCNFYLNGRLEVEDKSKNGTYVNGVLVGNGIRMVLKEGDKIGIGREELEVIVEPSNLSKVGSAVGNAVMKKVGEMIMNVRGY